MRTIEFRNNGAKDSLTGASTTNLFIESLDREIALRARLREPLSLLMISISETKDAYQIFLLNQAIIMGLRKEDFYCRASEDGFWIALRTSESGASRVGLRIKRSFEDVLLRDQKEYQFQDGISRKPLVFEAVVLEYRPGTKLLEWLKTIDEKYFGL
jgi:GGDEF domain-containing protein